MQPDDQSGNQGQPHVPITPTTQPLSRGVDPAALQAALDEPGPNAPAELPNPVDDQVPEDPQDVEDSQSPDDQQEQSDGQSPQTENGDEGDVDDQDEQYDDEDDPLEQPVSWVAHEYIHQEKGTSWFIIFTIVVIALMAISIFLMKSWSFAILLVVIAGVVVVYSRRPPRELTYSLTDEGLTVDQTLHKFDTFKSFGVIQDGEAFSVMLIPTRRFQPAITVYFPEETGEQIVDALGSRLPMRELHLDAVDRVVRILRL